MPAYLGIDTSNYTTSAALYDSDSRAVRMEKMLLPVKEGALGLKQSEAVFHHVRQLPGLMQSLFSDRQPAVAAIGVSAAPRRQEGSYMPCFLVGESTAASVSAALSVPLYTFSHQEGHVMAALYSADRMDLLEREFYAFHVSGGTTECLLVRYQNHRFDIRILASSLDLKAGQAIDRAGVMLGLPFPAGKELDALACRCGEEIRLKPRLKGLDCSLSGLENQCRRLLNEGRTREYIAKYCITFVKETIAAMTEGVLREYGEKPVVYAGGVMANSIIRQEFKARFGGCFAEPAYSSDNSAGLAILAALADQG